MTGQNRFFIPALIALSLAGFFVLLFSTTQGIGVSVDTIKYLAAAKNLLSGHGLGYYIGGDFVVMTHQAPLYSVVLAGFSRLGLDGLIAARWLAAALFSFTIALAGLALFGYTGSLPISLFGAFLVFSSIDLIRAYSLAMSEGLFICLTFLGLFFIFAYLNTKLRVMFVAAVFFAALASMTRYIGAASICTATLAILLFGKGSWRKKAGISFLFFLLSALPLFLWIVRGFLKSDFSLLNRHLVILPLASGEFLTAFATMTAWLIPATSPWLLEAAFSALMAGAVLFLAFRLIKPIEGRKTAAWRVFNRLPEVLSLYVLVYLFFIFLAVTFYKECIPVYYRFLTPVFIAGVVIALSLAQSFANRSPGRIIFVLLAAYMVPFYAWQSARLVMQYHGQGIEYASKAWKGSQTMQALAGLPEGALIYSNARDAVTFFLGRDSRMLACKTEPTTYRPNLRYKEEMDEIVSILRERRGVVAWFDLASWRWYLPQEQEVKEMLGLRLLRRYSDGAIYEAE